MASKVMSTSIVAVGASTDFLLMGLERLGAKAEERRVAILVLSQGWVMLSGNSLESRAQISLAPGDKSG